MVKPPPRKFRATLPMMWKVIESSQVLLDLHRRYEKAGGNFMALWELACRPDQRPLPRRTQLERWKQSVGSLRQWRDLPERLRPPLEEVYTYLRVALGSPVIPVEKPESATLPSLVAATLYEELRHRFSKRRSSLIRKDTLKLLQAASPRIFPQGTTTEALRKRIGRVDQGEVPAYHAQFFTRRR